MIESFKELHWSGDRIVGDTGKEVSTLLETPERLKYGRRMKWWWPIEGRLCVLQIGYRHQRFGHSNRLLLLLLLLLLVDSFGRRCLLNHNLFWNIIRKMSWVMWWW